MAKTTRTLNPLHFEDLEPHRFEDLVRQLVYDFRPWRRLEPTGRLGADDGIDIRGVEAVSVDAPELIDDRDDEDIKPGVIERLWIIQCKREKSVGPSDIKRIVKEAIPEGGEVPYGFILAAACEFSKKSRDAFILELRERGVEEFYIWGKADLEDQLFLPKNDHLLFAYFDISLQIKRRAMKSEIRSRLSVKRALHRLVKDETLKGMVLVNSNLPVLEQSSEVLQGFENKNMVYGKFEGLLPHGAIFQIGQYYAYVDEDRVRWDAMLAVDDFVHHNHKLPHYLRTPKKPRRDDQSEPSTWEELKKLNEINQAYLCIYGLVEYERILAIDSEGHVWLEGPHVFVEPRATGELLNPSFLPQIRPYTSFRSWQVAARPENRVEIFPTTLRDNPNDSQ